jgi:hypothetical protein
MIAALFLICVASAARAQDDGADRHLTTATWNGQSYDFVDEVSGADRNVFALKGEQKIPITNIEEEGGTGELLAFGFANADKDAAQELVLLLKWPVQHAFVSGDYYEVRIFDDLKQDQTSPTRLDSVDEHFNKQGCDCDGEEGKRVYPFKTIKLIKAELKKMGF